MSKKNKTLNQFLDNLDSEYAWRIKELSVIKSKIPRDTGTTTIIVLQNAMLRAGVTLLYAHWEGFIKAAADNYLNFVSLRRLKHSELQPCFIALCIRGKFQGLESKKFELQKQTVEFFLNEMDYRASIPYKGVIDTKSNLKFDVFRDICVIMGIDWNRYSLKQHLIDNQLLYYRNTIAHGKYLALDYTSFSYLYDVVVELLRNIKDDIVNAAATEQFKRLLI
ncbi:MAG: hypothetical protein LWX51_16905 [Deltaproteobacteria bacterium]|jgi:hypothetical protein|nr:hypothetical protein [Deltaproteobacteria bacterium]